MDPLFENRLHVTRREFFGRSACGLGTAALAHLLGRDAHGASSPFALAGQLPHFAAKAAPPPAGASAACPACRTSCRKRSG